MANLRSRLYDRKKSEEDAKDLICDLHKLVDASKSRKIRTYNFPQNRITDHRIKKSWHSIESVMLGDLRTTNRGCRGIQLEMLKDEVIFQRYTGLISILTPIKYPDSCRVSKEIANYLKENPKFQKNLY